MKIEKIVNEKVYIYEENFWTGKKKLFINNVEILKVDKKSFYDEQNKENYTLNGSFLTGVTLQTSYGNVVLCKNTWYENILIFLPLLAVLIGVTGGAIGGALAGLLGVTGMFVNALIIRSDLNKIAVIFLSILIAISAFVIWFLLYTFIVGLIL